MTIGELKEFIENNELANDMLVVADDYNGGCGGMFSAEVSVVFAKYIGDLYRYEDSDAEHGQQVLRIRT